MLNTNFVVIRFFKKCFNPLLSFITAHLLHTVDEVDFLASYEIEMTTEIIKLHGMSQFVKSLVRKFILQFYFPLDKVQL